MAGVLFVVCVPTSEYEANLTENVKVKSASLNSTNEDFIRQFTDSKSESLPSLRKTISTTDSLCETDDTSISYVSKTPKELSTATINSESNNQDRSNISGAPINKCHLNMPSQIAVKTEETHHHEQLSKVITKKSTGEWSKEPRFEGTISMKNVSR